eukprot:TRINITY_DN1952_c0_g1_i3.p1 TRINITY_DN1952_c0_g1~~TRINITY_DN1952_c0_g1_i3.p1  ORF type:complete len:383 (-),score=71.22 TRINITY_DN1952_c0_g1_i3:50-1198(-)
MDLRQAQIQPAPVPVQVMSIRLTDELFDELRRSSGHELSIKFGSENIIRVHDLQYVFTSMVENLEGNVCDCIQQNGSSVSQVGTLTRKLNVKPNLNAAEREKIKERTDRAEELAKSKKTLVADASTKRKAASGSTTLVKRTRVNTGAIQTIPIRAAAASKASDVRTRILHHLANVPKCSQQSIIRYAYPTGAEPNQITEMMDVLRQIANNDSGVYTLKPEQFKHVQVDTWPSYTADDRRRVRQRVREFGDLISDEDWESEIKEKLAPNIQRDRVVKGPLETKEQYDRNHKIFEKKFELYKFLDTKLTQSQKEFRHLQTELERCKDAHERDLIAKTIAEKYKMRKQMLEQMRERFDALHHEIKELKQIFAEFAMRWEQQDEDD